jgi:hypothetical protein
MARMSTSYIGSDALTNPVTPITIPGFDVLNPTSYAETPSAPTATSLASVPSTSTSSTSSTSGQNPYQQAVATLAQWQYQTLTQSLTGNTSDATSALYSSAGLNADQFANLAYQLEQLGANESGGTVDTTA